mmetsp:Transcript_105483/g.209627  ORF Transcript_105483/g.209627 Transcript_105483/m.209627 type:complete len:153 (+) Transcript_105483:226-684(+)
MIAEENNGCEIPALSNIARDSLSLRVCVTAEGASCVNTSYDGALVLPTEGEGSEGGMLLTSPTHCLFFTEVRAEMNSGSADGLCEGDAEVVASLPTPREHELTKDFNPQGEPHEFSVSHWATCMQPTSTVESASEAVASTVHTSDSWYSADN